MGNGGCTFTCCDVCNIKGVLLFIPYSIWPGLVGTAFLAGVTYCIAAIENAVATVGRAFCDCLSEVSKTQMACCFVCLNVLAAVGAFAGYAELEDPAHLPTLPPQRLNTSANAHDDVATNTTDPLTLDAYLEAQEEGFESSLNITATLTNSIAARERTAFGPVMEYVSKHFGNRSEAAMETYISLMEDACCAEAQYETFKTFGPTQLRNVTANDTWSMQLVGPDGVTHVRRTPEDVGAFIRENLLGPRDTVLAAFAAVTCSIFSGYFSTVMGALVSTIWFAPPSEEQSDEPRQRCQCGALACVGKLARLMSAVTGMLLNIAVSTALALRVWNRVTEYWDLVSRFNQDCGFLLSIKVLSYRDIFAGIMLGATSIPDLVLSVGVVCTLLFKLCYGTCNVICCLFVTRNYEGLIACQCHKCAACSTTGLCREYCCCICPNWSCGACCAGFWSALKYMFCGFICDVCSSLWGLVSYVCCCKWFSPIWNWCTPCVVNVGCCLGIWIVKAAVFLYLCAGGLAVMFVVALLISTFLLVAFVVSFVLHRVTCGKLGHSDYRTFARYFFHQDDLKILTGIEGCDLGNSSATTYLFTCGTSVCVPTVRKFINDECCKDKKLAMTSTTVAFVMGMVMVMIGTFTDAASFGWSWWYLRSINEFDWDGFDSLDDIDTGNPIEDTASISTNTSDSMDIDDDIDWSDQWAAIGEVVHTADFLLYVSYIKSWEFLPGIFKSVLSVDNLTGAFDKLTHGSAFERFLEAVLLLRSIASFCMGMTRVNLPDSHSSDVADEENLAPPSGLNEVLFENPAAKGSDDDGSDDDVNALNEDY